MKTRSKSSWRYGAITSRSWLSPGIDQGDLHPESGTVQVLEAPPPLSEDKISSPLVGTAMHEVELQSARSQSHSVEPDESHSAKVRSAEPHSTDRFEIDSRQNVDLPLIGQTRARSVKLDVSSTEIVLAAPLAPLYSAEEDALIAEPLFAVTAPVGLEGLSPTIHSQAIYSQATHSQTINSQTLYSKREPLPIASPIETAHTEVARPQTPTADSMTRAATQPEVTSPSPRPFSQGADPLFSSASTPEHQQREVKAEQPAAPSPVEKQWIPAFPPSSFRSVVHPPTPSPAAVPPATPMQLQTKALTPPQTNPERPYGVSRVMKAVKLALPLVQRMLPLLEGNVARAVSNLLLVPLITDSSRQTAPNLGPMEDSLTQLNLRQQDLVDQISAQNSSLKDVEERLAQVQTATDRNTIEQQELIEDLRALAKRVNAFAIIGLTLLVLCVLANVLLFLQLRHIIS